MVIDGNSTETGHIIVTTIGGRNGQPKQVYCVISSQWEISVLTRL